VAADDDPSAPGQERLMAETAGTLADRYGSAVILGL
jgi:hypothetical protein